MSPGELVVLFEHPEWQKPLFGALEDHGVRYRTLDLKAAAFDPDAVPDACLYFNQASPSAYVRGNTRAVPTCFGTHAIAGDSRRDDTEWFAGISAGAKQVISGGTV